MEKFFFLLEKLSLILEVILMIYEISNRLLKKSARAQKMPISGGLHPLPTPEKSLVGRSGRSGFGGVSFLRTFSTAC